MARLIFREFDASKPTYARRKFIAGGRHYAPGDLFDWKGAMVTPRRAKQMFEAGWIKHDTEIGKKPPEPVVVEPEVIVEDNETDVDAIDDMAELRRIADEIGAPYRRSKDEQREAIKETMNGQD